MIRAGVTVRQGPNLLNFSVMEKFYLSITAVPSAAIAHEIAMIAARVYGAARVFSVGMIGGYIHTAPAKIEVLTDRRRESWPVYIDEMHRAGLADYIY